MEKEINQKFATLQEINERLIIKRSHINNTGKKGWGWKRCLKKVLYIWISTALMFSFTFIGESESTIVLDIFCIIDARNGDSKYKI